MTDIPLQPPIGSRDADDDLWPAHTQRSGVRVQLPTAILVVLLVAAAGIWGGATLEKHHGSGTTAATSSGLAAFRAARTRGAGSGAPGAAGATASSGASGTVTVLQGNTLWLTAANGSLVKVKLTNTTTVTRNADSTKSALRPGDTVTVQGATGKNGTVTASSVSATAKGVTSSSGFAGIPGGLGGGNGSGG
jgi:hypothetical protein